MERIKKQKAKNAARPWLVFDCETDAFDGAPVAPFAWAWKTSEGAEGLTWDTGVFLETLKEFDGIALAHNGGKFDTMFLAENFEPGEIKIINGRLAEVKIGKATVRDSILIIPAPLSASGLKDDFDYSILARDKKHLREKYKTEINKYLMQDVYALFELVYRFYSRFGQRLTQAGAALATWEGLGGVVRRWGGAHDRHFRQFYYGGTCLAELKGNLGDGWDYFDIKSSYPRAMLENHPASHLEKWFVHSDISRITPQSFARIIAKSQGVLPKKGKHSTEYPHDEEPQEYFATGWEIIAGLETGTLKIERATIWRPSQLESLAPYVEKFYKEKLDAEERGDQIDRTIAKIFLNSLYGKYGAAAEDYKRYLIVPAGEQVEGYSLHAEIGTLDILHAPDPGQHYDVALAASVTGYARAALFRQRYKVKKAGGVVAYCDTDSIICLGAPREIFDEGKNLGQWEHVATLDGFHVGGKKLYAGFDRKKKEWKMAHKGFSSLDVSPKDIFLAARGKARVIARSAPSISVDGEQNFIVRTMQRT